MCRIGTLAARRRHSSRTTLAMRSMPGRTSRAHSASPTFQPNSFARGSGSPPGRPDGFTPTNGGGRYSEYAGSGKPPLPRHQSASASNFFHALIGHPPGRSAARVAVAVDHRPPAPRDRLTLLVAQLRESVGLVPRVLAQVRLEARPGVVEPAQAQVVVERRHPPERV